MTRNVKLDRLLTLVKALKALKTLSFRHPIR